MIGLSAGRLIRCASKGWGFVLRHGERERGEKANLTSGTIYLIVVSPHWCPPSSEEPLSHCSQHAESAGTVAAFCPLQTHNGRAPLTAGCPCPVLDRSAREIGGTGVVSADAFTQPKVKDHREDRHQQHSHRVC